MELSFQPLPHCVEEQGLLILHLFYVAGRTKYIQVSTTSPYPNSRLPTKMLLLLLLLFLPSLLSSKSQSFRKTTDTIQSQADASSCPNACICSLWAELQVTSLNLPPDSSALCRLSITVSGKRRILASHKEAHRVKGTQQGNFFLQKGYIRTQRGLVSMLSPDDPCLLPLVQVQSDTVG